MERRAWLQIAARTGVASLFSALGLGLFHRTLAGDPDPLRPVSEPSVLRPPGAAEEADFLARCIRCQRCQDACAKGAIQLAGPGDRTQSGTPFINAADNACNLCLECTHTCPTGALLPLEAREEVRMGAAVIDPRTCVSINRSGVCGACFTACPLKGKAITLGLFNAPEMHVEHCVGCGLCEEACILDGVRAIRVFSHREAA